MNGPGLTALVVDDELPALSELSWLLEQDERIGEVLTANSGTEALGVLEGRDVDVVFSDISMPGLDGMALARVIAKFSEQPQVVFVTAHDQHAVDAFTLAATDYVMKPVGRERLREAVRRVLVRVEEGERAARSATRRPTVTMPASTLTPAATSCASRCRSSRSSGASTVSSASTAPRSSPSLTSTRSAWTTDGARS
jgi:DNA-binding LytR/AlgR family response regulator